MRGTDRDEILEQVLDFLGGFLDEDGADVRPDAGYVLDSLAVVELVTFLEERFGLTLERPDLDFMETPNGVVDLILAKGAAGS